MRWLARFPFTDKTWLGFGHTVMLSEPLFEGSELQHLLLLTSIVAPDKNLPQKLTIESDPVEFLWVVPITTAEREHKIEHGVNALRRAEPVANANSPESGCIPGFSCVQGDVMNNRALKPTLPFPRVATTSTGTASMEATVATGPPLDENALLASLADGRRVDHRHHLFEVLNHDAVVERFVAVVECGEVDELFQIRGFGAVVLHHAQGLLIEGAGAWG